MWREQNERKERYFYILTPKGILEKTRLTINFMKRKMEEYDDLKRDLQNSKTNIKKK